MFFVEAMRALGILGSPLLGNAWYWESQDDFHLVKSGDRF
jgi:hypothetical protein